MITIDTYRLYDNILQHCVNNNDKIVPKKPSMQVGTMNAEYNHLWDCIMYLEKNTDYLKESDFGEGYIITFEGKEFLKSGGFIKQIEDQTKEENEQKLNDSFQRMANEMSLKVNQSILDLNEFQKRTIRFTIIVSVISLLVAIAAVIVAALHK